MRWRIGLILILTAMSVLLTNWPVAWQPFLDLVYGEHLYPFIQRLFRSIPYPKRLLVADVFGILILFLLALRLTWLVRKNLIRRWLTATLEVVLWISFGYFLFMMLWGLNYHRETLYSQLKDQGFTTNLSDGHWQFALTETEKVLSKLPADFDYCALTTEPFSFERPAAFALSALALANLPSTATRPVKPSHWSWLYTRLGVAGVYNPFTGEPTFNDRIFQWSKPFVMTHEFGHWVGYAHEYDADILAYWSLWLSPDPIWQYSAWLEWWMEVSAPRTYYDQMSPSLKQGIECYVTYINQQPRWQIRNAFWHIYEVNLNNQGIHEGLRTYKMGEVMALSSYQDWLFKKRNR